MTVVCDKCGKHVDIDSVNQHLPKNGLIIRIEGYYGGFSDPDDYSASSVIVCHDCSLELFRSIPKFQKLKGCHYSYSDENCCEFSSTKKEFDAIIETLNLR